MNAERAQVVIVLSSLTAEGTPQLALDLCRVWTRTGLRPVVVTLRSEPRDLAPDFDALGIRHLSLRIDRQRGYSRYLQMACRMFTLARRYRPAALLSMPLGWHAFLAAGARLGGRAAGAAHVGNYPPHAAGMAFRKFRWEVQAGRQVTDPLVCCSRYVQDGVVRHFGVPAAETTVIYNACAAADDRRARGRARGGRARRRTSSSAWWRGSSSTRISRP